MNKNLNKYIKQLTILSEQSQNKKILLEEMHLISQKAFALQDKIMGELDLIEATETDITKIQAAFAARESIWDIMTGLMQRELELKEKTYHKETAEERKKRHEEIMNDEQGQGCCGSHNHCCCKNHNGHSDSCENKPEKPKKKCCRRGTKCKK